MLEKNFFETGASTKNAGFACMGSASELLDDLNNQSEETVISLFEKRKKGLELMREIVGDNNISYQENGSYEWIGVDEKYVLEKLNYLNDLLFPINKKETFTIQSEKIKEFGFDNSSCIALIKNNLEGEINTANLMYALKQKAMSIGVEIAYGCSFQRYINKENEIQILVKSANKEYEMTCKKLFFCTNGFTQKIFPHLNIVPGRGQVLITKPIENLKIKGIFHKHKGYFYFREIDNRILFGGGRNLDFENENTDEFGANEKILGALKKILKEEILPNTDFEIDYSWSGIMAFGESKNTIIKEVEKNVFIAARCGGMGVALASLNAKELVDLIKYS